MNQATIGNWDITPFPAPATDRDGKLYFNFWVPVQAGGTHTIELRVDRDVARTVFSVITTPTPTPTITPTPAPTRVPRVLRHARHADAHYTVSVPSSWSGGRVTFFAKAYSGPPGPWVQANTIREARRYDIQSLKDAGVNLVGTYFKELYSSEALCGTRGYVVVRESALLAHFPGSGIGLQVDVCEADLHQEAEAGLTNEDISNEIIKSLRKQN